MNTKLKMLITGFLMLLIMPAFAQDLSESDKEALQSRVKDKVEEFVNYLSDIVNTNLSDYQRKNQIKAALVLFIGQGDWYNVTNEYGEKERRRPVRMQLSSLNRNYKTWVQMTQYLQNQYNNVHRYGKVNLESADVVRVDNIHKVSDDHYEAMAYFCQKYIAYKDGKVVYSDITTKKVKVYIDRLEIPGGVIWEVKLGDVYVTSTKPNGNG